MIIYVGGIPHNNDGGLCEFDNLLGSSSFPLAENGLCLGTNNTTTPLSAVSDIVVELDAEVADELLQLGVVLLLDVGDGKYRGGLLVDQVTETALTLNNAVRNAHLSAEGREPDDELNRVNIMGNDDQFGLLLLNQIGDVIQTVFNEHWLDRLLRSSFAFNFGSGSILQSRGFLLT